MVLAGTAENEMAAAMDPHDSHAHLEVEDLYVAALELMGCD